MLRLAGKDFLRARLFADVCLARLLDVDRHYGTLIGGAHAGIVGRLDALETELERAACASVRE